MKRQKNNNRVIKIVVPVIICLVAALVVAGYFLFRVNNISYEGNRHYSDEEMNNYIFGTDTPNAVVYNIFGKKNKQIPFIQKYEVETIWPDKMNVTIYEKAVVGYINYMGCNMYFDKDGIVVYYTHRCPFTEFHVRGSLVSAAKSKDIPLRIIELESMEQAQNAPTPATIFTLFYNGKFVTTDLSVCLEGRLSKALGCDSGE